MGRGPSYPYVDLAQAVQLARKMYNFAKRAPAPIEAVIADAWGYSQASSSGQKVLAALRAYGLIEDVPDVNGKSIKLTQRSIQILLGDSESDETVGELKKAALSPKWYEFCWKTWGSDMPTSMRSNLLVQHGFVDTTVDGFLKDYKKTVAFAHLVDELPEPKPADASNVTEVSFKIGDWVQWEINGILQMPKPHRLRGFSEDRNFAFVEGSQTGIPTKELTFAESNEEADVANPPQKEEQFDEPPSAENLPTNFSTRQDVFSLEEGRVTVLWPSPLSPESLEDLNDWFELLIRKISRSKASPSKPGV